MTKDKVVTVRLPADLVDRTDAALEKMEWHWFDSRTRSELIRRALVAYLDQLER